MRQSELNLAMTLFSIVLMHILCNILRVILGVLAVTLVGTVQEISLVALKTYKYSQLTVELGIISFSQISELRMRILKIFSRVTPLLYLRYQKVLFLIFSFQLFNLFHSSIPSHQSQISKKKKKYLVGLRASFTSQGGLYHYIQETEIPFFWGPWVGVGMKNFLIFLKCLLKLFIYIYNERNFLCFV